MRRRRLVLRWRALPIRIASIAHAAVGTQSESGVLLGPSRTTAARGSSPNRRRVRLVSFRFSSSPPPPLSSSSSTTSHVLLRRRCRSKNNHHRHQMTNTNLEFARSATSKDGLAHPRLARAADELRRALPATLGGRVLLFVRAFKFASDLEAGLGAEPGDELGGVKVNVWLTPDAAVVNAASAPALVVHNLSTADWAPAFVPAPEGDEDDPTLFEVRAHSRCDPFFPCVEVRAHSRCDHSSPASRRDRFRDTKLGRRLLFVSSRATRVAPPPGARHAAAAAPPHRHAFRPSARFAVRPLSLFFTSLFLLSRSQVRRRHGAGGVPPEPRRRLRRAACAPRRVAAVPLGLREPPRRPPVCVRQLKWPDPLAPRRELPSRRRSSLSLSSSRRSAVFVFAAPSSAVFVSRSRIWRGAVMALRRGREGRDHRRACGGASSPRLASRVRHPTVARGATLRPRARARAFCCALLRRLASVLVCAHLVTDVEKWREDGGGTSTKTSHLPNKAHHPAPSQRSARAPSTTKHTTARFVGPPSPNIPSCNPLVYPPYPASCANTQMRGGVPRLYITADTPGRGF